MYVHPLTPLCKVSLVLSASLQMANRLITAFPPSHTINVCFNVVIGQHLWFLRPVRPFMFQICVVVLVLGSDQDLLPCRHCVVPVVAVIYVGATAQHSRLPLAVSFQELRHYI